MDDETADCLLDYANLLAREGGSDIVRLQGVDDDGHEVGAVFLLNAAAQLVSETAHATVAMPDNSAALDYMRSKIALIVNPPPAKPALFPDEHML
jgi:hypothetical protein